jgi:hypothetical protein
MVDTARACSASDFAGPSARAGPTADRATSRKSRYGASVFMSVSIEVVHVG